MRIELLPEYRRRKAIEEHNRRRHCLSRENLGLLDWALKLAEENRAEGRPAICTD